MRASRGLNIFRYLESEWAIYPDSIAHFKIIRRGKSQHMKTKNLLKGSFNVFTLLLLLIIATVLIAVPFLLLDHFFSLEVAYLAYIMVVFVPPVYAFIKRRIFNSTKPS